MQNFIVLSSVEEKDGLRTGFLKFFLQFSYCTVFLFHTMVQF